MSRAEVFDRNRPLLLSIAYRMTGSVMEAEDEVQEASEDEVRSSSAYLSKVVTRLCIDRLRSARVRREQYVGPWLPEPLLGEQAQEIGPYRGRRRGRSAKACWCARIRLTDRSAGKTSCARG